MISDSKSLQVCGKRGCGDRLVSLHRRVQMDFTKEAALGGEPCGYEFAGSGLLCGGAVSESLLFRTGASSLFLV